RRGRGLAGLDLDLDDGRDLLLGHDGFAPSSLLRYSLATWLKSISTSVSRPKMFTSTLSFSWSALISAIWPEKSANGPSFTRTDSPTSYSRRGFERLVGSSPSILTWRNDSTSRRGSGEGFAPWP